MNSPAIIHHQVTQVFSVVLSTLAPTTTMLRLSEWRWPAEAPAGSDQQGAPAAGGAALQGRDGLCPRGGRPHLGALQHLASQCRG